MNLEIFAEKEDKSGIEKLFVRECKCGGAVMLMTNVLKNGKMYWFRCARCGKHSGWRNEIRSAITDWHERVSE